MMFTRPEPHLCLGLSYVAASRHLKSLHSSQARLTSPHHLPARRHGERPYAPRMPCALRGSVNFPCANSICTFADLLLIFSCLSPWLPRLCPLMEVVCGHAAWFWVSPSHTQLACSYCFSCSLGRLAPTFQCPQRSFLHPGFSVVFETSLFRDVSY